MVKEETTKADGSAVAYRYKPNPHGYSLPGIPARDLTQEEFDALSDEDKRNVTKSGVYEEESKGA